MTEAEKAAIAARIDFDEAGSSHPMANLPFEAGHLAGIAWQKERESAELRRISKLAKAFSSSMKHAEHKTDEVQGLYIQCCWRDLDAAIEPYTKGVKTP